MLGTSHGVPSEIRYCSCYMIEVQGNIYIFDGGAPVIDLLLRKGKDLTKVKAFFNSHFHGDHITGFLNTAALFSWFYREVAMDIYLPDERAKFAFTTYLETSDNVVLPSERIGVSVYEPGVVFDDGIIKVTAIPTKHNCGENKRANAFLIEAEGKSILYTGDMSAELDDFPKVAFERFIDVIISECAHFEVNELSECMEKVNTDIFAVSHLYPMHKTEELERIADKFDFKLQIAKDDDVIEL